MIEVGRLRRTRSCVQLTRARHADPRTACATRHPEPSLTPPAEVVLDDGDVADLHDIVIDCRHPASAARFWAEVLDDYQVAPYDEEELARLRANGIDDPEDDPTVLVERVDGTGPRLFFQLVPEPKVVKNRVHLDLTSDDLPTEMRRLIGLNARVLAQHEGFVVLAGYVSALASRPPHDARCDT